jgi:thiol-disulfide isomerase/thioredoxin
MGDAYTDRDIKDLITGETIPYKDIIAKNKATVIYRWGSWCTYSAALLPQLRRMHEKYHAAGLEVIMRTAWGDPEGE